MRDERTVAHLGALRALCERVGGDAFRKKSGRKIDAGKIDTIQIGLSQDCDAQVRASKLRAGDVRTVASAAECAFDYA